MSRFKRDGIWLISVLLAGASLALGCNRGPEGTPNIEAPSVAPARAAMIATLDAWKAGDREQKLTGSKPTIVIVDSQRTERPLVNYEVVGVLPVTDKVRPFAVRLQLDAPRESVVARYYVLGQDPLYVYRQEDFDLMIHWEHKMPPAPAAQTATAADAKPAGPGGG